MPESGKRQGVRGSLSFVHVAAKHDILRKGEKDGEAHWYSCM
jgi:hypothetical protein